MAPSAARIAIAEHWSVLRRGLIGLLQGSHTVVADVGTVTELRAVIEQRPLDLVLLGDSPSADLIVDVSVLHVAAPELPIIVMCEDIDAARLRAVLRHGACGVVSKKVDDERLLDAVSRVLAGDRVVGQRFLPLLYRNDELDITSTTEDSILTRRELDVLIELAHGLTNRQIADALLLGESTIKTHLGRIYAKLEVDDRHHAVGRALELGLLG